MKIEAKGRKEMAPAGDRECEGTKRKHTGQKQRREKYVDGGREKEGFLHSLLFSLPPFLTQQERKMNPFITAS